MSEARGTTSPAPAPGGPADTAGQAWTGRSLTGTGFDDDTGAADPGLREVLAGGDDRAMTAALAGARLLVPVVAAPAEVDRSGPLAVEKATDMAVVTLTAPDGQRALPVFTGTDALAAWDPAARPSPVTAARAAAAAVAERCEVMVLDVAGPAQRVLAPSMVWALAQQQPWLPAHLDPRVRAAVQRAGADRPGVAGVGCEDGSDAAPGALRVVLHLRPGLDAAGVQRLATAVGEELAADGEVRARIDGLVFAVRPAG